MLFWPLFAGDGATAAGAAISGYVDGQFMVYARLYELFTWAFI